MPVSLYEKCNSVSQGSSQLSNCFSLQSLQNTKDNKMHDKHEGLVRPWQTKPWLYRGVPRASEGLKRLHSRNPRQVAKKKLCSCLLQRECPLRGLEFLGHPTQHPYTLRKLERIQHYCTNMSFLLAPPGKYLQGLCYSASHEYFQSWRR